MGASILQFLKSNGQGLDAEIAQVLRIPISQVRQEVELLSLAGEVISCDVIRYINGKEVKGISCRLSGSIPVPARGPKIGAKRGAEDTPIL
ncbi:MAG: ArsR family transcriptional regulator [Pseudomonadota bacterium]